MPRINMSEARLNDLVYLTLNKLFFEGQRMKARECDIRVCMNMAEPESIKSQNLFEVAILSPTEKAPASHTIFYDVDTDKVFEECLTYLEDHWIKQTFEEIYENQNIRKDMAEFYKELVAAVMSVSEEECAVTITDPSQPDD